MKYIGLILTLTLSAFVSAENFTTTEVLNGKVALEIPDSFAPMTKEALALKYPSSRRPTEALADETGGISIAFNHTASKVRPSQLKEAHTVLSNTFHNLYPSAKWIRDEVIELITAAIDTQITI